MVEQSPVRTASNIAWFRLAEFVKRREKERALSLYRLLSHSVQDRAVATQLQGDLLRAFEDERAYEAYYDALCLYEASARIQQALVLGEHIILYLIELKKYEQIGSFIDQTPLLFQDKVLLYMRCIIGVLLYSPQDRKIPHVRTCLDRAIHVVVQNHMISNEAFWTKLRLLDEELYQQMQQQILSMV